jgi:hypothetical protein
MSRELSVKGTVVKVYKNSVGKAVVQKKLAVDLTKLFFERRLNLVILSADRINLSSRSYSAFQETTIMSTVLIQITYSK